MIQNYIIDIHPEKLNTSSQFLRLVERIRTHLHNREARSCLMLPTNDMKNEHRLKNYTFIQWSEYLKRRIEHDDLTRKALFRFYSTIQAFLTEEEGRITASGIGFGTDSLTNTGDPIFHSVMTVGSSESIRSVGILKDSTELIQSTSNLLIQSQQSSGAIESTLYRDSGLLTRATLKALLKEPRQRNSADILALQQLLSRCESTRRYSVSVRSYIARSLLLLNYHPETIISRQGLPSFIVYIIVYGQCQLLLETSKTTVLGKQLNIGDVFGDESLHSIDQRLNGLITTNHTSFVVFFPRDIKAYDCYLSDMMKKSLLDRLQTESTFIAIQWRQDILNYFLRWSKYKQYSVNEPIYGNESNKHPDLYFIVQGQVSFIRIIELPLILLKHPEFSTSILRDWDRDIKSRTSQQKSVLSTKSRLIEEEKKERAHLTDIVGKSQSDDSPMSRVNRDSNDTQHIPQPSTSRTNISIKSLRAVLTGNTLYKEKNSTTNNGVDNKNMSKSSALTLSVMGNGWSDSLFPYTEDEDKLSLVSQELPEKGSISLRPKKKNWRTVWQFLEIFVLSHGHYFGFETDTQQAWYLARTTVDLISIPKHRFEVRILACVDHSLFFRKCSALIKQELGDFAPMVYDKIRQDFIDIMSDVTRAKHEYIKKLKVNKLSETNSKHNSIRTRSCESTPHKSTMAIISATRDSNEEQHNVVPGRRELGQYKENIHLMDTSHCGTLTSLTLQKHTRKKSRETNLFENFEKTCNIK